MPIPELLGYCWIPTTIGYYKCPILKCNEGATFLQFNTAVGDSFEGTVSACYYGDDTFSGTELYSTGTFEIIGKNNNHRVTLEPIGSNSYYIYLWYKDNGAIYDNIAKASEYYKNNSFFFLATYDNTHYYFGIAGSSKWFGKNWNSQFEFQQLPQDGVLGYGKFTAIRGNTHRWDLYSYSELDDIIQNVKFTEPKEIVNFYRTKPEGDILVNRGDTVNLEFTAVYDNGNSEVYTDVVYSELPPESVATFSGNSFTISENCRASIFTAIAKPNVEDTTLYAFVQAKILNPVNPYLPDGGGISGGGAQSGPSNAIGSFNGTPGPSISENLPVGSSGPDIASSGMYTKYLCNNALLDLLAGFFWEDNIGIQALKAVLGNPIDSIISLTAYPFALETLVPTSATTIYFGQYDSHFSAFSLTKSSFQIDWGSVTIPFFWGSFLDYSPYTKIQLYLPWGVGFVSIDPNEVVPWSSKNSFNQGDFVNGTIRVITNIELDKGACVHNIIGNNGRVIGSFGGVVGKQVPVTGSDNSARILAMISAAVSSSAAIGTSAGGTLAAGNGMTMAERAEGREMIGNYKSYVGNTVQSLSNALSSPPSYPRAGTFSDATNTLGYQYPYLIISRPSQSVPQQYGRFMGYPSNIFHAHLGEVRGYTEVSSIHLENINATANELDELESILKGGVLL